MKKLIFVMSVLLLTVSSCYKKEKCLDNFLEYGKTMTRLTENCYTYHLITEEEFRNQADNAKRNYKFANKQDGCPE